MPPEGGITLARVGWRHKPPLQRELALARYQTFFHQSWPATAAGKVFFSRSRERHEQKLRATAVGSGRHKKGDRGDEAARVVLQGAGQSIGHNLYAITHMPSTYELFSRAQASASAAATVRSFCAQVPYKGHNYIGHNYIGEVILRPSRAITIQAITMEAITIEAIAI